MGSKWSFRDCLNSSWLRIQASFPLRGWYSIQISPAFRVCVPGSIDPEVSKSFARIFRSVLTTPTRFSRFSRPPNVDIKILSDLGDLDLVVCNLGIRIGSLTAWMHMQRTIFTWISGESRFFLFLIVPTACLFMSGVAPHIEIIVAVRAAFFFVRWTPFYRLRHGCRLADCNLIIFSPRLCQSII